MMKNLAIIFGVILLAATPVFASDKNDRKTVELDKVPEKLLLQSMTNLTVCIRATIAGQVKIAAFVKELQNSGGEIPDDERTTVNRALSNYNNLGEIVKAEAIIFGGIVTALTDKYNHTEDELQHRILDVVKATDEGMEALLSDADDLKGITDILEPKMQKCADMTEEMVNEMKKYQ